MSIPLESTSFPSHFAGDLEERLCFPACQERLMIQVKNDIIIMVVRPCCLPGALVLLLVIGRQVVGVLLHALSLDNAITSSPCHLCSLPFILVGWVLVGRSPTLCRARWQANRLTPHDGQSRRPITCLSFNQFTCTCCHPSHLCNTKTGHVHETTATALRPCHWR